MVEVFAVAVLAPLDADARLVAALVVLGEHGDAAARHRAQGVGQRRGAGLRGGGVGEVEGRRR